MKLAFALMAYVATIPLSNWMIGNVGTVCLPYAPCLVPVGFGLMAPSGVLMVGAALVLRDVVHSFGGARWAIGAIVAGSALSALVAPSALVAASATAFLISELADLAVYAPLRRRRLYAAVLFSGVVGAFVDSLVFLSLAFGNIAFLPGQFVGKAWMSFAALPLLWLWNARRHTQGGLTR